MKPSLIDIVDMIFNAIEILINVVMFWIILVLAVVVMLAFPFWWFLGN